LLDLARGPAHAAYDRSIDTLASRLRHKLQADSKAPSVIRTVRNGGYVFETADRSGEGLEIYLPNVRYMKNSVNGSRQASHVCLMADKR